MARQTSGRARARSVVVLGAGGFLGTVIADHLHSVGYSVTAIGRSGLASRDYRALELTLPAHELGDILEECSPAALVHAIGSASVARSMRDPWEDLEESIVPFGFVLDRVRRARPACRVVFISSAAVYGEPSMLPVTEGHALCPISAYGAHKRLCEELAADYRRLFGVKTTALRVFSAFGERLERQVVHDIIEKLRAGGEVELRGSGNETRDFVHVADVARAVECVIAASDPAAVYNVASGIETTIRELAEQLAQLMGTSSDIRFTGSVSEGDPLRWRADLTRLRSLGFAPRISLEEGLRRVVEYRTRAPQEVHP